MEKFKIFFWEKKSQLEVWFSQLNISSLDVIRFASFFGVGFIAGLLFKRWSKYIILITLSCAMLLAVLQGFSIITINFTTIQRLTGLQSITNMQTIGVALFEKIKEYTWELGCSGMGFIIGFKTG